MSSKSFKRTAEIVALCLCAAAIWGCESDAQKYAGELKIRHAICMNKAGTFNAKASVQCLCENSPDLPLGSAFVCNKEGERVPCDTAPQVCESNGAGKIGRLTYCSAGVWKTGYCECNAEQNGCRECDENKDLPVCYSDNGRIISRYCKDGVFVFDECANGCNVEGKCNQECNSAVESKSCFDTDEAHVVRECENGIYRIKETCNYGCKDAKCISECTVNECADNELRICNEKGLWDKSEPCPFGCENGHCLPAPPECQTNVCVNQDNSIGFISECKDGKYEDAVPCHKNGNEHSYTSCANSNECSDVCKNGERMCVDEKIRICSNGSFVEVGSCNETVKVCKDGDSKCEGDVPSVCSNGQWTDSAACTGNTPKCALVEGKPLCVVECTPGSMKCALEQTGFYKECDGTGVWSDSRPCKENVEYCRLNNQCGGEQPCEEYCDNNTPHVCSNNIAQKQTACGEGETCKEITNQDGKRVARCFEKCDTNGITACDGDGKYKICDDGVWSDSEPCTENVDFCKLNNGCVVNQTCTNDGVYCEDNTAKQCSGGVETTIEECGTDRICIPGSGCVTPDCDLGPQDCKEGSTSICSNDEHDFGCQIDCLSATPNPIQCTNVVGEFLSCNGNVCGECLNDNYMCEANTPNKCINGQWTPLLSKGCSADKPCRVVVSGAKCTECEPGKRKCDDGDNSSGGRGYYKECNPEGDWESHQCTGSVDVCTVNMCDGDDLGCTNGETKCDGNSPKKCNNGQWESFGESCNVYGSSCMIINEGTVDEIAKCAFCKPGISQCVDDNKAYRVCDAEGNWGDPKACTRGCDSATGMCKGEHPITSCNATKLKISPDGFKYNIASDGSEDNYAPISDWSLECDITKGLLIKDLGVCSTSIILAPGGDCTKLPYTATLNDSIMMDVDELMRYIMLCNELQFNPFGLFNYVLTFGRTASGNGIKVETCDGDCNGNFCLNQHTTNACECNDGTIGSFMSCCRDGDPYVCLNGELKLCDGTDLCSSVCTEKCSGENNSITISDQSITRCLNGVKTQYSMFTYECFKRSLNIFSGDTALDIILTPNGTEGINCTSLLNQEYSYPQSPVVNTTISGSGTICAAAYNPVEGEGITFTFNDSATNRSVSSSGSCAVCKDYSECKNDSECHGGICVGTKNKKCLCGFITQQCLLESGHSKCIGFNSDGDICNGSCKDSGCVCDATM